MTTVETDAIHFLVIRKGNPGTVFRRSKQATSDLQNISCENDHEFY